VLATFCTIIIIAAFIYVWMHKVTFLLTETGRQQLLVVVIPSGALGAIALLRSQRWLNREIKFRSITTYTPPTTKEERLVLEPKINGLMNGIFNEFKDIKFGGRITSQGPIAVGIGGPERLSELRASFEANRKLFRRFGFKVQSFRNRMRTREKALKKARQESGRIISIRNIPHHGTPGTNIPGFLVSSKGILETREQNEFRFSCLPDGKQVSNGDEIYFLCICSYLHDFETSPILYSMAKTEIHPTYFPEAKTKCACGAAYVIGATKEAIEVEICMKCHPFYTGEEKLIDTAGRIDKFKTRRAKAAEPKAKKVRVKKTK